MYGLCASTQYKCENSNECIFQRYICDGVKDCRDGTDESIQKCGLSPCSGKISCQNTKRCIPWNWCCDPRRHETCDHWRLNACCQFDVQGPSGSLNGQDYSPFVHRKEIARLNFEAAKASSVKNSANDPTWGYQSAIFLITGCTLAFICLLLVGSFLATKFVIRRMRRSRQYSMTSDGGDVSQFARQIENLPVEHGLLLFDSQPPNVLNETVPPPPPYTFSDRACIDTDSPPPVYNNGMDDFACTVDLPPAYSLHDNNNPPDAADESA